jgi:hypothetical protein
VSAAARDSSTCRNGHAWASWAVVRADRRRCAACKSAGDAQRRGAASPGRVLSLGEKLGYRRWQRWLATVDLMIERLRREEGFDSRDQEWRTFGEVRW